MDLYLIYKTSDLSLKILTSDKSQATHDGVTVTAEPKSTSVDPPQSATPGTATTPETEVKAGSPKQEVPKPESELKAEKADTVKTIPPASAKGGSSSSDLRQRKAVSPTTPV